MRASARAARGRRPWPAVTPRAARWPLRETFMREAPADRGNLLQEPQAAGPDNAGGVPEGPGFPVPGRTQNQRKSSTSRAPPPHYPVGGDMATGLSRALHQITAALAPPYEGLSDAEL